MQNISKAILTAIAAASIAACGGGKDKEVVPDKTFKPTVNATNATFTGTVATGAFLINTPVFAYDAKGAQCATGTTDQSGKFSITGKCVYPVMLAADTPDNLGTALFNAVPTISKADETVLANITPMTTALMYLTNGTLPTVGDKLSMTLITKERQDEAQAKLNQVLKPIYAKLNLPESQNLLSGALEVGKGQDMLFDQVSMSYEPIPTLNQKVMRIYFPSENRPITLILDTDKPSSLRVDTGLGIAPEAFDASRLLQARDAVGSLAALINGKTYAELEAAMDTCFLHNGLKKDQGQKAIFDGLAPWGTTVPTAKNFKLLRYNTNVNFDNSSEENINGTTTGDLAYFSFEYLNSRGSLVKTHLWAVRGNQTVNSGCTTSGSDWKILGNQRSVYTRTSSYSVHKIKYNAGFSGRTDEYGSGLEFILQDNSGAHVYALVSGPGIPANGAVFVSLDGTFLYSTNTPTDIRKAALLAMATKFKPVPPKPVDPSATPVTPPVEPEPVPEPEPCDSACLRENAKEYMPKIFDAVADRRSILLTDQVIAGIPDSFYGNQYVVRFFKNYEDLNPSKTYIDSLPKRPHLSSEIKPIHYPSFDVNIDQLVTALQTPGPVTANWSLPKDFRGHQLDNYEIGFDRRSCTDPKKWPSCTKRSEQFNEYFFSSKSPESGVTNAELTPRVNSSGAGTKTVYSAIRLFVLDKLNRPLEVSIGMDYSK